MARTKQTGRAKAPAKPAALKMGPNPKEKQGKKKVTEWAKRKPVTKPAQKKTATKRTQPKTGGLKKPHRYSKSFYSILFT